MKHRLPLLLGLVIVLIGAGLLLKTFLPHRLKATVVSFEYSSCSQDTPTTSCDSYPVIVKFTDGTRRQYTAAGFSKGNSTKYDAIRSVVIGSQQHSKPVFLTVNHQNQLVGARY